jgi:hypothetical protein
MRQANDFCGRYVPTIFASRPNVCNWHIATRRMMILIDAIRVIAEMR